MADEEMKGFVTRETICKLFGLTGRRIDQLVQDGVIERTRMKAGPRYEVGPTVQKYVKYLSDKAYGRERNEREAQLKEQKLKAEVALKESQGELHRLRTDIAAGNYISVDEAKADYGRFFVIFKSFAMSIPAKIAGRIAGYVDPVEVRSLENDLQNEVSDLLKDFVTRAVVDKPQVEDVTKPKKRGRPRKNATKKDL
ncbi:MAG: hypothetical protein K5770_00675 [Lachnospiraceae bacterium]|nr:hypothetical protein [Lachnospiraceae bacterium]